MFTLRNNIYDVLDITTKRLIQKDKERTDFFSNAIRKSNDYGVGISQIVPDKIAEEWGQDVNDLAETVQSQFTALRADFIAGRINLVQYREYLKSLRQIFDSRGNPIVKNDALKIDEIKYQIDKFL